MINYGDIPIAIDSSWLATHHAPIHVLLDKDVYYQLTSGACKKMFQKQAFGQGTIKLVVVDDSLTTIGQEDLTGWADDASGPFYGCESLFSIDFIRCPNVTAVGEKAFLLCSSLTTVLLPPKITSIGNNAFYRCDLLSHLTLPPILNSIGDSAFYSCSSLTKLQLPPSLKSIGVAAFYCCSSLSTINLPPSLNRLGAEAFSDCKALTAVTIPDGVTILNKALLNGCANLTNLTLPKNKLIDHVGDLFCHENSSLDKLTLPPSITSIGLCAFMKTSLKEVVLPLGLVRIHQCAFHSCMSLEIVIFQSKLHKIGRLAFAECPNLKELVIAGVEQISFGSDVFENCHALINRASQRGFTSPRNCCVNYLKELELLKTKKRLIICALLRFNELVHRGKGSEEEKVKGAKRAYDEAAAAAATISSPGSIFSTLVEALFNKKDDVIAIRASSFLHFAMSGGGCQGVLGEIMRWL